MARQKLSLLGTAYNKAVRELAEKFNTAYRRYLRIKAQTPLAKIESNIELFTDLITKTIDVDITYLAGDERTHYLKFVFNALFELAQSLHTQEAYDNAKTLLNDMIRLPWNPRVSAHLSTQDRQTMLKKRLLLLNSIAIHFNDQEGEHYLAAEHISQTVLTSLSRVPVRDANVNYFDLPLNVAGSPEPTHHPLYIYLEAAAYSCDDSFTSLCEFMQKLTAIDLTLIYRFTPEVVLRDAMELFDESGPSSILLDLETRRGNLRGNIKDRVSETLVELRTQFEEFETLAEYHGFLRSVQDSFNALVNNLTSLDEETLLFTYSHENIDALTSWVRDLPEAIQPADFQERLNTVSTTIQTKMARQAAIAARAAKSAGSNGKRRVNGGNARKAKRHRKAEEETPEDLDSDNDEPMPNSGGSSGYNARLFTQLAQSLAQAKGAPVNVDGTVYQPRKIAGLSFQHT